ncbi:BEN domain-containing protein 5 [Labeo rohita]|uniref:BEN domain-containing protein 5 n=1 Tax=Labeo rohita TaxID=84645 RepID=A0ABQ8L8Z7_LABRO|nr:BEN domain-containing protein 5 [Labeo rohita]
MFAYVKYIEDGCKEIVPISYIKDFDHTVSDLTKTYWLRWQEKFFKGQILLLKESREEIEQELAKGKRVRVRLLKESTPPPSRSEKEEAKTIHVIKSLPLPDKSEKSCRRGKKRNNLLALLKERKMKRKQSPLCPTPIKRMKAHTLSDSLSEEDDDGGVVPEKLFEEAKQQQLLHQKKINNMSVQLQETKNKLEEQERIRAEVEAENKELRSLNMQLQQQLLKTLNSPSTAKCRESGCLNKVEPSVSLKGDEIHLGGDIRLRKEAWSRIQSNTRDSLFVKELAVAIWGTKTLGETRLTGKECPTTKTTRQPLTPKKLQTLKGSSCHKVFVGCQVLGNGIIHFSLFWCDRSITVYMYISFQSASRSGLSKRMFWSPAYQHKNTTYAGLAGMTSYAGLCWFFQHAVDQHTSTKTQHMLVLLI